MIWPLLVVLVAAKGKPKGKPQPKRKPPPKPKKKPATRRSYRLDTSWLSDEEAAACNARSEVFNATRLPQIGGPGDWWCRGWPMLFDATGIVPVVTRATESAVAGQAVALLDLVDCNGRGRIADLSLYVSLIAPEARDAVTWSLAQDSPSRRVRDDNRISVWWTPVVAGTYDVTVRLVYFDDRCHSAKKDHGTYLGAMQPRTTTWYSKECDNLSILPSPQSKVVVVASNQTQQQPLVEQCRDGETADGAWMSPRAAEASGFPWTGTPDEDLVFLRPRCAYHFFSGDEAAACLQPSLILFVGDSIIRGLYANFVRLLGGSANEDQIKIQRKGDFDEGHIHVQYVFEWGVNGWTTKAWPAIRQALHHNNNPVTVVANFGALHQQDDVCTRAFRTHILADIAKITELLRINLVLYSPSWILGARTPTISPARALLTLSIMRSVNTTRVNSTRVLDFTNVTRARLDLTKDGTHYETSASAVVLLNMLCPRRDSLSTNSTATGLSTDQKMPEAT